MKTLSTIINDILTKRRKRKEYVANRNNHGLRRFVSNLPCNSLSRQNGLVVPKGQIAIARDFALVLNDDGRQTLLGHNDGFRQFPHYDRIVKIAATYSGYMGLSESGRIVIGSLEDSNFGVVSQWNDVVDLVGCEDHILAVLRNGTVVCADGHGDWTCSPMHETVVKNWRNIKQVAAGFDNVMGLTKDGRVLYHRDGFTDTHFYDKYSDVVQIDCYSHYYGTDSSMVLHKDGTVSSDTFDSVESWEDIIQISVGADVAIGLKSDGTIEMVDDRGTRYDAKKWKNLAYVECKYFGVVGITKKGKILSLFA